MKFTSESGRAARAKWQEKYGGTQLHRDWCSDGYWSLATKLGSFERANLKIFGIHYTQVQYRNLKKTGYRQQMLWRVK